MKRNKITQLRKLSINIIAIICISSLANIEAKKLSASETNSFDTSFLRLSNYDTGYNAQFVGNSHLNYQLSLDKTEVRIDKSLLISWWLFNSSC